MKSLISPDYCPAWQVPTLMVRILIWLGPFPWLSVGEFFYWLNSSSRAALLRSKSWKSLWLIFLDPTGDFDQTLLKISQIPNYLVRERERDEKIFIVHGAIISIIWELNLSVTRHDRNATTIDGWRLTAIGCQPSCDLLTSLGLADIIDVLLCHHPSFYNNFEWSNGTSQLYHSPSHSPHFTIIENNICHYCKTASSSPSSSSSSCFSSSSCWDIWWHWDPCDQWASECVYWTAYQSIN